jgi:ATF/CREB family transcription factor
MAAATQTARTSPQNSKMSSPKDSKSSLPVVTKTEGAYSHPAAAYRRALAPAHFSHHNTHRPAPARASLSRLHRHTGTMTNPSRRQQIRPRSRLAKISVSRPHPSLSEVPILTLTTAATTEADAKPATTNAQPLAPPPKPAPSTTGDTPDYFNTVHNPFSLEPNVFEQSFVGGNGSVETPGGRTVLPPVANLTSPSPLPGITPGWQSLRAGPLSPAMLNGPTGQTDYFSESFRGFPTPNESSLRTGLTPGGGGSMFPAPSPNTQAIFNLQSAGVTPGSSDFQQAALRAAAAANHNKANTSGAPTSQPEGATAGMDRQNNFQQPQQQQQRGQNDPYANHDVSSAANDLLSFASQNGGGRSNQPQFSMAPQQQSMHAGHMPVQPIGQNNHVRRDTKGSINSMASGEGDFSESGQSEQAKTATRSRAKKGAANGKQAAGSKRKTDDAPKGSRKKSNAAPSIDDDMMGGDSDDDMDIKDEDTHKDGRKMTDEEKRKNFLERNRYVY